VRRKSEAGQALAFTALSLVVLLGLAGLGIDMGVLRYQKRLQQTAADSAAIAGATNLSPYTGVQAGAQNAAGSNGFTDNTGGGACAAPPSNLAVGSVTVTVCNPPIAGPHIGQANYVEVYVTVGQPTYFSRIVGVNSETITARAVATNLSGGTSGNNTGCLYTLGPPSSSIEGVSINGSAILNAPTCGIVDNGNFNTKGNKLDVNAGTFGVAGSANVSGPGGTVTCSGGTSNCPTYNTPSTSDPLASLPPPCSPCAGGSSVSIQGNGNFTGTGVTYSNGVYTVSPGTYSQFSINGGNVVFSPGTYIFDGSGGCPAACLDIPGNSTITGDGVTFYFTNGATLNMTGTPSVNLSAPSSGTYQGILMYQDPLDTNVGPAPSGPTLGGNTGSTFNGILYFPSDQLTFYGNNASYSVGVVIADALALSGNPNVTFNGAAGVPGGLPPGFTVGSATLVE